MIASELERMVHLETRLLKDEPITAYEKDEYLALCEKYDREYIPPCLGWSLHT